MAKFLFLASYTQETKSPENPERFNSFRKTVPNMAGLTVGV
jgi:hypothetical protein